MTTYKLDFDVLIFIEKTEYVLTHHYRPIQSEMWGDEWTQEIPNPSLHNQSLHALVLYWVISNKGDDNYKRNR